jgi:ketopantoate reductase
VRVAILGAGALGTVYGVRLARGAAVETTFVLKTARLASPPRLVIERASPFAGVEPREELLAPHFADLVPLDADVVLLAVATQDLGQIAKAIGSSEVPIVALTPMFPAEEARVKAELGDRVYPAMPSVVAYARHEDGVVRYWRAPAPTRIEEPRKKAHGTVVEELARTLGEAGIRARLELGIHEKDPATTACFIAIGMAVAAAGSVEALTHDDRLASIASRACREGVRLGYRLGHPDAWARLAPALAAPWALRAWTSALETLMPEGLVYLEQHFGRKLLPQHRLMIADMVALAEERRLPHEALDELAGLLRAV